MQEQLDTLVQSMILEELEKHPEGLTEKQLYKIIKKKLKKIKKMLDIYNSL